eukprot:gnl/Chilomastix_cuspidata/468.p1 GENE.gnl/Chilomastix_cuspidata/468~~gnl/Chilomastix_cuspidata/468.p1  ORF type:complete len:486 (+),score=151.82 gnl/Chilomastix_cuspidata/468:1183-2640(+)
MLIIAHGTLVSHDRVLAGAALVVDDAGIISFIGPLDEIKPEILENAEIIDASGCYVCPGGVDAHVHFGYPQGPHKIVSADSWYTGSRAAIAGGTTTVIDFVEPKRGESMNSAFVARRGEADGQSFVDYSFHMTIHTVDDRLDADVATTIAHGVRSFKLYTAYDIRLEGADLSTALRAIGRASARAIVHCEDNAAISWNTAQAIHEGRLAPRDHRDSRPKEPEIEATRDVIHRAQDAGADLHIAHVSTGAAARLIAEAAGVTGEVCPHHIFLDESAFDTERACDLLCAPPIRTAAEGAALMDALVDPAGGVDFVVTDHCPFQPAQRTGLRTLPAPAPSQPWSERAPTAFEMPGGVPGVQCRVPLLWTEIVHRRGLSPTVFVNAVSYGPAARHGLCSAEGGRGSLAVGWSGDVVVIRPTPSAVVYRGVGGAPRAGEFAVIENSGYSPYEGTQLQCSIEAVVKSGEVAVRRGEFVARAPRGAFLRQAS